MSGCQVTADQILKQYAAAQEKGQKLPWVTRGYVVSGEYPKLTDCRQPHAYRDAKLREMARVGIAFHHAGLDVSDRRDVESHFLGGSLSVIVSTSVSGSVIPANIRLWQSESTYRLT